MSDTGRVWVQYRGYHLGRVIAADSTTVRVVLEDTNEVRRR